MNSPPSSATWPGKTPRTVWTRPPTRLSASKTRALIPRRASSVAADRPARPAPTTATFSVVVARFQAVRMAPTLANAPGAMAPVAATAAAAVAPCANRRRPASPRPSPCSASRSIASCALCPVASQCADKRARRINCAINVVRLIPLLPYWLPAR